MLLLDTDVMVDLWRGYAPALEWFRGLPETPAISVVTALELLNGCRNRREQEAVEQLIEQMDVLYLDEATCIRALGYFREFHLSHNLGLLDALIAATAVLYGRPLCSFNEKHYRAVSDLRLVKPYERL